MERTPETRENTTSLEEKLVERLRDWVRRTGPLMHSTSHHSAELKFIIFTSETMYLDDETPYIDARVEETLSAEELGGWIGEPEKKTDG